MKKSEIIKQQAQAEENDFKAFNLYHKSQREERYENFKNLVPKIEALYKVDKVIEDENQGKFTITLKTPGPKVGRIIDYYPKSNRFLERRFNEWKNDGYRVLCQILEIKS